MTIEEKAKAYDDAIKRANAILEVALDEDEAKGYVSTIFPELKGGIGNVMKEYIISILNRIPDKYFTNDLEDITARLEGHGKKVPKFKKGDWITWKEYNGEYFHIVDIKDGRYVYENGNFDYIDKADEEYRLWDVRKDVKAGDIIHYESDGIEYVMLVKGVREDGGVDTYCRYSTFMGFGVDIYNVINVFENDATPATEEQRKLLFSKMYDDGYDFDFDKMALVKNIKKPDDIITPKFKKGEWIISDDGEVHHIINVVIPDGKFYTRPYYIYDRDSFDWNDEADDKHRLWTIQDAKVGDILVRGDSDAPWIGMLREYIQSNESLNSVCFISAGDRQFVNMLDFPIACIGHNTDDVHPANKEQRDLLFKKMKEAGFEWDQEELVLKKAEEGWEPRVGDYIRKKGTTEPVYVLCSKEGTDFSFVQDTKNGAAGGYLSLYALKDYELVKRPKTIEEMTEYLFEPVRKYIDETKKDFEPYKWNAQDEERLDNVISILQDGRKCQLGLREISEIIDWLKYIKKKVFGKSTTPKLKT